MRYHKASDRHKSVCPFQSILLLADELRQNVSFQEGQTNQLHRTKERKKKKIIKIFLPKLLILKKFFLTFSFHPISTETITKYQFPVNQKFKSLIFCIKTTERRPLNVPFLLTNYKTSMDFVSYLYMSFQAVSFGSRLCGFVSKRPDFAGISLS